MYLYMIYTGCGFSTKGCQLEEYRMSSCQQKNRKTKNNKKQQQQKITLDGAIRDFYNLLTEPGTRTLKLPGPNCVQVT